MAQHGVSTTGSHRLQGFSLVEVLVALVVGMISIMVVLQSMAAFEGQKRSTTSGSVAYQNGALAMHLVERELLSAGNGLTSTQNLLYCSIDAENGGTSILPNAPTTFTIDPDPPVPIRMIPVMITDGGGGAPDSITVMYSTAATLRPAVGLTADPGATATALSVGAANLAGFNDDDLILVAEQTGGTLPGTCAIAQVTDTTSVTDSISIAEDPAVPFNRSAGIGIDYSPDAQLINLGADPVLTQYGVANGALVSADLLQRPPFDAAPRLLVEGIVNFQAQYGVDTDGDDLIDSWVEPTGGSWAAANLNVTRVAQVRALRLGLVVRSSLLEKGDSGGNCTTSPASLTILPALGGSPGAPASGTMDLSTGDARCYRYKVFETVIPFRNMIWSPVYG